MKLKKVQIKDLISPDYNPRMVKHEDFEDLKKRIKELGYINPIIVNEVNNHIISGNQRIKALKELGYTEIPAILIKEENIDLEKIKNVSLNVHTADWDTGKLDNVFNDLELSGFDITLTGFNTEKIKQFSDSSINIIFENETTESLNTESNLKTENNIDKDTCKKEDKKILDFKPSKNNYNKPKIENKKEEYEHEPSTTENEDIIEETYFEEEIENKEPIEEKKETYTRPDPDYLPVAPIKRIIKDAGAERVSDNAARYLGTVLEENAKQISEKAVMMANVAGRKTIIDEDFEILLKN